MGRPTKYDEGMPQQLLAFFSEKEPYEVEIGEDGKPRIKVNKLPTLERFAVNNGVHIDTLYEWASKHQEFSEALRVCKCIQRDMLLQGGLSGAYKDTITKLILSTNHGMSEKIVQENTGPNGGPIRSETTTKLDISGLTDEQLRAIASIKADS